MIFKYKSRSLTGNLINSAEIAKKSSIEIISKKNLKDENISAFIDDLIKYKLCEVENLFNIENVKEQSFNYDIKKFLNLTIEDLKIQNLESLLFDDLKKITFSLSDDQKNQLKSYNELFGNSIEGISRTLSRVYVKKLFRKPIALNSKSELLNEFQDNNSRRWGGGLESI